MALYLASNFLMMLNSDFQSTYIEGYGRSTILELTCNAGEKREQP
jgi:hypothetical protein